MSGNGNAAVETVAYFEVAPAATQQVAAFLKQWKKKVGELPGANSLTALQRTEPKHHFVLVAKWDSREHYEAARDGAVGGELRSGLAPHLICGIDVRIHNAFIGSPDSSRGATALTVVTHVDVPPPHKDACIALLETQVKASRAEIGCASLEVFQQADRPNHFSVVENWASDAAYDAHIIAPHTRTFRTQLTPLSGALYDERIYAVI